MDEKLELQLLNYIVKSCDAVDIGDGTRDYIIQEPQEFIFGLVAIVNKFNKEYEQR